MSLIKPVSGMLARLHDQLCLIPDAPGAEVIRLEPELPEFLDLRPSEWVEHQFDAGFHIAGRFSLSEDDGLITIQDGAKLVPVSNPAMTPAEIQAVEDARILFTSTLAEDDLPSP